MMMNEFLLIFFSHQQHNKRTKVEEKNENTNKRIKTENDIISATIPTTHTHIHTQRQIQRRTQSTTWISCNIRTTWSSPVFILHFDCLDSDGVVVSDVATTMNWPKERTYAVVVDNNINGKLYYGIWERERERDRTLVGTQYSVLLQRALTRCRWRWSTLMHFSFWFKMRCDVTQTSRQKWREKKKTLK